MNKFLGELTSHLEKVMAFPRVSAAAEKIPKTFRPPLRLILSLDPIAAACGSC